LAGDKVPGQSALNAGAYKLSAGDIKLKEWSIGGVSAQSIPAQVILTLEI
jgi:hypothetical protein